MGLHCSKHYWIPLLAAATALLVLTRPALARRSENSTYESIDWIVADSDLVVSGRVVNQSGPLPVFEVEETFKGPKLPRFFLALEPYYPTSYVPSLQHRWLLALRRATIEGIPLPLTYAPRKPLYSGLFDLDQPYGIWPTTAIGIDFRECKDVPQLLDAVRRAVAGKPDGSSAERLFKGNPSPWGTGYFLIVPVDRRLEELGQTWLQSDEPDMRGNGITSLGHFKSPANIRLLRRAAAEDPMCRIRARAGRWTTGDYELRAEAYEILERWHGAGERPALKAPDDLYWDICNAWPLLAGIAVCVSTIPFLPRRLRRLRPPPTLMRPAGLLILFGIAVLLLWIRSYWRADELLVRSDGKDSQIASFRGGLQLSRVSAEPIHPGGGDGAFLMSCPLGTELDARWETPFTTGWPASRPSTQCGYGGIRYESGSCLCPLPSYHPVAFSYLRIPLWPAVLLTLLPGSWLLLRSKLRHRHRMRHGLCLACGYNLTGNVSGVCPECGVRAAGLRDRSGARDGVPVAVTSNAGTQ